MGIRLQSFTGCLERRVELEPLVYRAMAQREGELMVNLLFDFWVLSFIIVQIVSVKFAENLNTKSGKRNF